MWDGWGPPLAVVEECVPIHYPLPTFNFQFSTINHYYIVSLYGGIFFFLLIFSGVLWGKASL